jgi:hypothetical protein
LILVLQMATLALHHQLLAGVFFCSSVQEFRTAGSKDENAGFDQEINQLQENRSNKLCRPFQIQGEDALRTEKTRKEES